MGTFLTAKSRIQQLDVLGYWKTIDNELYATNKNELILVPRRFWSDGYTIPALFLPFTGDKNKYDVRPAHQHDLFCRFHEIIYVNASVTYLKYHEILRKHKGMTICEDIPINLIEIKKISKFKADNLLKEMMLSCDINSNICNLFRLAVTFNLNWNKNGTKSLKEYNLFKEDIGLINDF